jgi:hypothetical protein
MKDIFKISFLLILLIIIYIYRVNISNFITDEIVYRNNNKVLTYNEYYLENDYKNELSGKVGNIKSISILTSNEYIKARKAMGYGYEWTEGNWLASVSLNNWWISSAKEASVESSENKVYAVNKDGTYRLMKANAYNYVRPVITIEKKLIEKTD